VQWIAMPSPARIERWSRPQTLHPALLAIGRSRQRQARLGIAEHRHEAIEIHLVSDGELDWAVDGRHVRIGPDEVLVTRPGEPHGSPIGTVQPCTLRWFHIDPAALADAELARRASKLGGRYPAGAGLLASSVDAILHELQAPGASSVRESRAASCRPPWRESAR
jgi:hypothetical protein